MGILLLGLPWQTAAQESASLPKPKAEHVVLCVWDGMRPDFITQKNTPVLYGLAAGGTFFANNHSQYITTTEVNGTVLATGVFPAKSGIIANREYRPQLDRLKAFGTEDSRFVALADELTGGKYIDAVTVAEAVQKAGGRTFIAGTKPIALLHDRATLETKPQDSVTLFAGKTIPRLWTTKLTDALGRFPDYPILTSLFDAPQPNTGQNRWTTRALTEVLWKDQVPRFTVLWLGDPDFSQHLTAPGSPTALAAIADSDTHLGMLISALKAHGVYEKTDIVVVSDHGFSTIHKAVDLSASLKSAGLNVSRQFKTPPQKDEILLATNGGSASLYVIGHSEATIARAVQVLQKCEWSGPIFTRAPQPGTFSLADGRMDSKDAPDIVFSFRTLPGDNQFGVPGLIYADTARAGIGTHGTLGRTDVHNTLVAAGPDIRGGFRNELPSGNIDVAPTLFHLLGLKPPAPLDGRILAEAIAGADWHPAPPEAKTVEANRDLDDGRRWTQTLKTTDFAGKTYFDEGNAKTTD